MNSGLDVHFHGIERSAAVEARVAEKYAKLKRHFSRMTACRVVIEAPTRIATKPTVLAVKIEISVPNQRALVITHEREGSHVQEDLLITVREAFDAAIRRVDDLAEQQAARTKLERNRRRPAKSSA
jgi:ribosome-associated translation inhibitor RaiA